MSRTITVAPVRRQTRVNAAPERAFEIFTKGMTRWWPPQHSINRSPIREIILEPWTGGKWLERGEDNRLCQWGRVLAWAPPERLTLAWQITAEWRYDPALVTELDVRFIADGEGTLVKLEHRLDGYGEQAERMRQIFDGPQAWAATLECFAATTG